MSNQKEKIPTTEWLQSITEPLARKIGAFAYIKPQLEVVEELRLDGRTRLQKGKVPQITLFVGKKLLNRKNIQGSLKIILIHELCHTVNLSNPDKVMAKHFPEHFKVWDKIHKVKALNCEVEYKRA